MQTPHQLEINQAIFKIPLPLSFLSGLWKLTCYISDFQTATHSLNSQQFVTSIKSPFTRRFIKKIPLKCFIKEFVQENNPEQKRINVQHILL